MYNNWFQHEDFEDSYEEQFRNDIALVKTKTDVTMSDYTKIIALPEEDEDYERERCDFSGWGRRFLGQYAS